MKANKKFIEEREAVSAVIGVILMVAITVAIAATVYVYVSSMTGEQTDKTPSITFEKDNQNSLLRVTGADPLNLQWDDVTVLGTADRPSGTIDAGDELSNCAGTVKLRWDPTNTLLGTWEFT